MQLDQAVNLLILTIWANQQTAPRSGIQDNPINASNYMDAHNRNQLDNRYTTPSVTDAEAAIGELKSNGWVTVEFGQLSLTAPGKLEAEVRKRSLQ